MPGYGWHIVLALAWVLQCLLYLWAFRRFIAQSAPVIQEREQPPVSIILCARNAARELRQHLPVFLEQDYPEFEVIVVNDNSEDDTETLLRTMQTRYTHLRSIHLQQKKHPGKKHALSEGIAAARYPWLALSDADCRPAGNLWLKTLIGSRQNQDALVLGYGAYAHRPGFINRLIRFETAMIAAQYMNQALKGQPYMGVGRNMAYTKELFQQTGGLQQHWHQASGDDDLFVQEAVKHTSVSIALSPQAFTVSAPKTTLGAWIRQKKRHLGTASAYPLLLRWCLAGVQIVPFLFYIFLAISMVFCFHPGLLVWLALKWLLTWVFFIPILRKLGEKDLILFIPLLDLIYIFVLPLPALASWKSRKDKWT